MPKGTKGTTSVVASLRLDAELLAEVDAYAERLGREAGIPVSRNAAVAKLLRAALAQVGTGS